jgi:hypothetical protein
MPRFDQTGPEGKGSMTGRRMGKCTNPDAKGIGNEAASAAGAEEIIAGSGPGRRFGFGRRVAGRGNSHRGAGRGSGQGLQNRFRGGQQ